MTLTPETPSSRRTFLAPLALFILCAVAFVPLVHRLGFYWDDWPSIWFLHMWGPGGYRESFAVDRPLLAWIFMLTTPLMGKSPLNWQVLSIFARFLASLAWWWTLRGVWPKFPRQVLWVAMLFAVYPGFSQQYIAVTYSNGFLVFALFIFSLGSMVWAYRRPRWLWPLMAASLAASAFSMFTTEYFFGLELLRPALLWIVLQAASPYPAPDTEPPGARHTHFPSPVSRLLSTTINHQSHQSSASRSPISRFLSTIYGLSILCLPYLMVAIPFLVYRVFFSRSPRGQLLLFSQLSSAPLETMRTLLAAIGGDFIEVNFQAWYHGLDVRFLKDFDSNVLLQGAAAVLAAFALVLFFSLRAETGRAGRGQSPAQQPSAQPGTSRPGKTILGRITRRLAAAQLDQRWALQAILLGVYAFLVSGWSIWVTDLHIELLFPFDRFTLITVLGTSLLAAGLVGLLTRAYLQSALLLGILVSLSVTLQFQQRLLYRQEWLSQRNFFWQLAWRVPAIRPGTTLMTSEIPFTYYTDNSLSAPLNWIYDPDNTSRQMSYLLYDIEARLNKGLPAIQPDIPINMFYRAKTFKGSTSQAIVFFYDPPRCLKVLDPGIDRFLPVRPLYIKEATPLSRLDLIQPGTGALPALLDQLLGPEPAHGWCYYFEKAELYNQLGNWNEAARSADQAIKLTRHFTEKNVSELIPFVEAYAHTGQWEKALQLTAQAIQIWDKTRYPLCDTWQRIAANTPPDSAQKSALTRINNDFGCKIPLE